MSLTKRLVNGWKKSELSISDMAVWFNAQRRTMETWLHGVQPHSCRHSQILLSLELLEKAIAEKSHFPVPLSVTQYQRKNYILKVRDVVSGRVSKSRSTK